jgi:hypothetical protein
MAQIKIRRGTEVELSGATLALGELGYTTDTKKIYIGNGISNTLVGATILDEDGFISNSANALATQQSIKAYIASVLQASLTASDVDDVPVNGATSDPISSNWAYDHINIVADPHSQYLQSVVAGTDISIDNTDPSNPIISATSTGGGDITYGDLDGGMAATVYSVVDIDFESGGAV